MRELSKRCWKIWGLKRHLLFRLAAIPVIMDDRDVVGQAQTGTGKTAAYAIPMLMKIDP